MRRPHPEHNRIRHQLAKAHDVHCARWQSEQVALRPRAAKPCRRWKDGGAGKTCAPNFVRLSAFPGPGGQERKITTRSSRRGGLYGVPLVVSPHKVTGPAGRNRPSVQILNKAQDQLRFELLKNVNRRHGTTIQKRILTKINARHSPSESTRKAAVKPMPPSRTATDSNESGDPYIRKQTTKETIMAPVKVRRFKTPADVLFFFVSRGSVRTGRSQEMNPPSCECCRPAQWD